MSSSLLETEAGQHRDLQVTHRAGEEANPATKEAHESKDSVAANSSLKLLKKGRRETTQPGLEGQDQYVSASAVLGLTALMAAASGLGAVPFFFVGTLSARWSALANAVACGVMLAASFDLVHEGEPYGPGLVILGVMSGEELPNPVMLSALKIMRPCRNTADSINASEFC